LSPASWLRAHAVHLGLFVLGLVGFGAVAGDRLAGPSGNPHFALQADAWLRGQTTVDRPRGDDWAYVETVVLDDGRRVRGRRLDYAVRLTDGARLFATTTGERLPVSRIARSEGRAAYMSFPPAPSVLMLPQVLVVGPRANDVAFTVVFAAAALPLAFAVLRRLRAVGLSQRTAVDDAWLVGLLGFGSVFFFSAVGGRVWYTAHVVGVVFALAYAWASIEARHPVLAGLAFGLAATTRTPLAFMFPLLLLEAWRVAGGDWRRAARTVAWFAAPVTAIAVAAAAYNLHRFDALTEFGHAYLRVRQQAQIEEHGLFSYAYLARNLTVAFTLLPELPGGPPWIALNGHGLAMWVTTPALLLLVWPHQRPPIHRALWLTVALVAVPTFFYQNDGWFQFGYRFSLDYLPFLVMLLAVGGRPLRWPARALIAAGVAVNLFGALTFERAPAYYRPSPDVVIRN
jgi:hypothetical protein